MITSGQTNKAPDPALPKRKYMVMDKLAISAILLISILGSILITYATRWGPWVFSDSTVYLFSAKNLIAGHSLGLYGASGAFHPLLLHPPFYSLLLGFFGSLGSDLVETARWLNIVLFGLTIMLVGSAVYAFTKSTWLSIGCSFLVFTMPAMVDISSGAMSEPLFIFTGFAGIFFIILYIKNTSFVVLIAAALLSGLSLLTRYAGLSFIITGVIGLLFFNQKPWIKRSFPVLIYIPISCFPIFGWLIWISQQSGDSIPINMSQRILEQFSRFRLGVVEIVWSWLPFTSILPSYSYNLTRNLLLIFFLLMLILTLMTIRKLRRNHQSLFSDTNGLLFAVFMVIFVLSYLFVLAFSYIFRSPTLDLIARTLLPAQIAVLLGLFSLLLFFIKAWPSIKWLLIIPILMIMSISISYMRNSIDIVTSYHHSGYGYTSFGWQNSEMIKAIKNIPENIPLISNDSSLVLFYTGRPAYDITELMNHEPQNLTTRFGDDQTDPAQNEFRENGAALILFKSSYWQFHEIYGDDTDQRLDHLTKDLRVSDQYADGEIYYYPHGNK